MSGPVGVVVVCGCGMVRSDSVWSCGCGVVCGCDSDSVWSCGRGEQQHSSPEAPDDMDDLLRSFKKVQYDSSKRLSMAS